MTTKKLGEVEVFRERFKTVEDSGVLLEVQLDGVSISIADLVQCANQLNTMLENRGVYFEVADKDNSNVE